LSNKNPAKAFCRLLKKRDQDLILLPISLKLAPCLQADMPRIMHSSVTYYRQPKKIGASDI
jgi:hypothetical protein